MRAWLGLVAVVLVCSSCSWVFMSKPEDNYSASTQPQCSDSAGWPVVDTLFAGMNFLGAYVIADDEMLPDENKIPAVIGGIAWGIVHLASAATGRGWATKCQAAKADYEEGGISAADESNRRALEARLARDEAKQYDERKSEPSPREAVPRGFFCSSSPTAGFCFRGKAECRKTRDVTIAALPDLGECSLTESAWCFADRCAPSEETCTTMRDRLVGTDEDEDESECVESK